MLIDFEAKRTFNQTIDIVDPGNCCIKCENEAFAQWYLVIKTLRGVAHYLEIGPIAPDVDILAPGFIVKYSQMKFNEKKIFGLISNYLNDPKKEVSSATEDLAENALEDIPDIAYLFDNIN